MKFGKSRHLLILYPQLCGATLSCIYVFLQLLQKVDGLSFFSLSKEPIHPFSAPPSFYRWAASAADSTVSSPREWTFPSLAFSSHIPPPPAVPALQTMTFKGISPLLSLGKTLHLNGSNIYIFPLKSLTDTAPVWPLARCPCWALSLNSDPPERGPSTSDVFLSIFLSCGALGRRRVRALHTSPLGPLRPKLAFFAVGPYLFPPVDSHSPTSPWFACVLSLIWGSFFSLS